jgi:diguanylate cyclase (GGDEF)-like protein
MDLSVPVFCRVAGEKYQPVVIAMDAGHPDCALEKQALGVNHGALSAKLMEDWGLPPQMTDAARHHHDPDAAADTMTKEALDLARIMHLAYLCASVMTSKQKGEALRELRQLAARWFGRGEDEVLAIMRGISPNVDELAQIVNVDIGGDLNANDVLDLARQELVEISLNAATELSRVETRVLELEKKASIDALTGLNNRATFDATLAHEWSRRVGEELPDPLGLLMLDVDHFKKFNDSYGHQAGDDVLRAVAKALKGAVRDSDVACRYGGEEFAVVAPYASGSSLKALGERLRRAVEKLEVVAGGAPRKVTVSIGAASISVDPGARRPEELLKSADDALYRAKDGGRNRVELAEET